MATAQSNGRAAAKQSRRQIRVASATDELPPLAWVPTRVFFTTGVGRHETQRVAIQRAMEEAGVADANLVKTSSVIPPGCEVITRERGLRLLRAGNIVHAVIAQGETNEPHERVTAALCWAQPEDETLPGYITEIEEQETKGKSEQTATDEAGEALITIVGDKLGTKVDGKTVWGARGRGRTVRVARKVFRVGSVIASAVGPEQQGGQQQYAVALALAVFI